MRCKGRTWSRWRVKMRLWVLPRPKRWQKRKRKLKLDPEFKLNPRFKLNLDFLYLLDLSLKWKLPRLPRGDRHGVKPGREEVC